MNIAILCPGQGAQAVGMGRAWFEANPAARRVFEEADEALGDELGPPLSQSCFEGPAEHLNRTDVAQPAIYACAVASHRGLVDRNGQMPVQALAGLSLGEYTALHLAGVFDFLTGLRLVVLRGKLMQEAAEASPSGMVALLGVEDDQARALCDEAAAGGILVRANYNAPGQVVLSGDAEACDRALEVARGAGVRASRLAVAGAFHSPLMQPAADRLAEALARVDLRSPSVPVWSNVTAQPHEGDAELLRRRLVEQIVSPVRWSETCRGLARAATMDFHELAPGTVLRGLMRRIDPNVKVTTHDRP